MLSVMPSKTAVRKRDSGNLAFVMDGVWVLQGSMAAYCCL